MNSIERIKHLIGFMKRARSEYNRELDERTVKWDASPDPDPQPKGSTTHEFSIELFPVAKEYRPVAHVTEVVYLREYRTIKRGRRTRTVVRWEPKTTVTKLYLHIMPKWLGPSSARNPFGITVQCGLGDGLMWMAPTEAKSREEAPPCKTMDEALHIIALYKESALGEGIQATAI
jgi:hypothetical protein